MQYHFMAARFCCIPSEIRLPLTGCANHGYPLWIGLHLYPAGIRFSCSKATSDMKAVGWIKIINIGSMMRHEVCAP